MTNTNSLGRNIYDDLVCYKQIPIESHGKLKFFLEKHSTKEGTWGCLHLDEGEIDFIFLNGSGQELSRTRISEISQKERLAHVQTVLHDLNQPLNCKKEHYNFVFSTVSLQFLKTECIPSLLNELQEATMVQGFHYMVFPIQSELYSLPTSFTFLPKEKEMYHFYQDSGWSILEYKESTGLLHKLDEYRRPLQGLFGHLLAQKIQ